MHKVVIDTNVILSGILFGGIPALLLDAIQKQKFVFCTSKQNYEEVLDKLTYKFLVDRAILDDVVILFNYGVFYTPITKVPCDANYLITGDQKHLLSKKVWKTTKIISPHEAQNILL